MHQISNKHKRRMTFRPTELIKDILFDIFRIHSVTFPIKGPRPLMDWQTNKFPRMFTRVRHLTVISTRSLKRGPIPHYRWYYPECIFQNECGAFSIIYNDFVYYYGRTCKTHTCNITSWCGGVYERVWSVRHDPFDDLLTVNIVNLRPFSCLYLQLINYCCRE